MKRSPEAKRRSHEAPLAQMIRAEQLRHVYLHSPTTTIGSLVAAAGLVWTVADTLPTAHWLSWLGLMLVHQCLRIVHYRQYMSARPNHEQVDYWSRRYMVAIVVAGILWGSAGVALYVPDAPTEQTYIGMILFGIVGVTSGSLSIYAPAFYTLNILSITPFILRTLAGGSPHELALGIPIAIASVAALSFGRNVNRLAYESIRRSFENLELIDELQHQKSLAETARLQAEAANRSKTRFFATASHDLRQPLHAMGLFTAALSERSRDPDVSNIVDSINASVGALEQLFNELLDLSKIDAGAIRTERTDFAIARLLDRLRCEFESEANQKGLRLRLRSSDLIVRSDAMLVERMLRNLLSNAIRYTLQGGILVSCRRRGGKVSIEVWDTGIGIAQHQRGRIFDEFYQANNPERSSRKGFGLGLSIVRRLAHLLNTEIELASRTGRGSTFRFTLPQGQPHPASPAPLPHASGTGLDLRGRLIVVVDDESAIVAGTHALLTGWGAQVIGSTSGEDLLERIYGAERLPDLVIADYRLAAAQTGLQVIERLRQELDPEIPAILLTGSATPERLQLAARNNVRLLLKPVLPIRLQTLIEAELSAASADLSDSGMVAAQAPDN